MSTNSRIEQDTDRGSPVLVQCRWFQSPTPSLDKQEQQEQEVNTVSGVQVRVSRPSVHFGDDICDLFNDHVDDDVSEPEQTRTKEDATNQTEHSHLANLKKISLNNNNNNNKQTNVNINKDVSTPPTRPPIPIVKIAKVTSLSSPPAPPVRSHQPPALPAPVIRHQEQGVQEVKEVNKVGVTIKVYAKCLAPDIEYKTVIVTKNMSSRELICLLLSKCRMKHRDPKLFYLTMDVTVKKTGIPIKRTMVLEEEARPAQLRSCNPWGECKFSLQMRKGGLVRVYDSVLVRLTPLQLLFSHLQTSVWPNM